MKIIYPETQTVSGSSATSENGSYPVSNLFDDKPGKLWKAADSVQTATITVAVLAGGSNSIALFNTNATSATVTAKNNGGGTVKAETFTMSTATRSYDRLWMEYTAQTLSHTVTIALTTTATTIEAGVVKAGVAVDFRNPKYGISEGVIDYSTVEQLSNGAKYVDKRDIVRRFGVSILTDRATDFYNMWDIYNAYGQTPMAALIAEDILDMQWCCFGTMEGFSGSHDYLSHTPVSFSFEETV
jgi:hypothetical protein